jgi:hypothetical protein
MKHGSGIKDRDDKSSGIEIHMTDDFAKINPTDPLILGKQAGTLFISKVSMKRLWSTTTGLLRSGSRLLTTTTWTWPRIIITWTWSRLIIIWD